jgi:ferritin
MISKTLQEAINEQIHKEFYSSYLYLAMAAWFENKNLGGFAQWLKTQEGEERSHAMKFYGHLADRGGKIELKAIAAPVAQWKTSLEVFKEVQAHEAAITASINSLYELALKEKDYPTQILLQWFITEQVEEEKSAADIVAQLELIEERGTAIPMLDHQLAKRGK